MTDRHERISLLALQRIFYQHPKIACQLMKLTGSASVLFKSDRGKLREYFGTHEPLWASFRNFNDWKLIERDLKETESSGFIIVGINDDAYPAMLKQIHDPPPVLMVKGEGLGLLDAPCIGVVGSRKASGSGREIAAQIAEALTLRGYCVVSGLAYGIDSAAHRGAVHGGGFTIAVMGSGLDNVYPSSHVQLSHEISRSGLIMSEFPLGTWPCKSHFPQRNRIISGMSLGVLVVEAAIRSGSLITARFALEQGRDVFAVPGTGGAFAFRGSNKLIRDGAILVEDGDEIADQLDKELYKLPFLKKPGHYACDVGMDSALLSAFPKRENVSVDFLVAKTNKSVTDVLRELTELLLGGVVEELPGRRFRLKGAQWQTHS